MNNLVISSCMDHMLAMHKQSAAPGVLGAVGRKVIGWGTRGAKAIGQGDRWKSFTQAQTQSLGGGKAGGAAFQRRAGAVGLGVAGAGLLGAGYMAG